MDIFWYTACMKTAAQETTEYLNQLKELLHQSQIIRDEIARHLQLNKLQDRVGGIKQQLEFIRRYVTPQTVDEKARYFKHNRLALKLIHRHLEALNAEATPVLHERNAVTEAEWLAIEALRQDTLRNLAHIEKALKEAKLDSIEPTPAQQSKDILLYQVEVAGLLDKTALLLQEIKMHVPLLGPIFEQIHHLHHELQFMRLHAYSRNSMYLSPQQNYTAFFNHHLASFNQIHTQLAHLHEACADVLKQNQEQAELQEVFEEIQYTILQFEERTRELEDNKLHYLHYPGAYLMPAPFDPKK